MDDFHVLWPFGGRAFWSTNLPARACNGNSRIPSDPVIHKSRSRKALEHRRRNCPDRSPGRFVVYGGAASPHPHFGPSFADPRRLRALWQSMSSMASHNYQGWRGTISEFFSDSPRELLRLDHAKFINQVIVRMTLCYWCAHCALPLSGGKLLW